MAGSTSKLSNLVNHSSSIFFGVVSLDFGLLAPLGRFLRLLAPSGGLLPLLAFGAGLLLP